MKTKVRQNTVVRLFTRPVIEGKRKWILVNPKYQYPDETIVYLRWLPRGATNYSVKALLPNTNLKLAQFRERKGNGFHSTTQTRHPSSTFR
jgi:hypothetical protein